MYCPLAKSWEKSHPAPYSGVFFCTKNARREPFANFELSGKEQDGETGFYYYGARYLNPRTSMWISADPAVGDYVPSAPVDEEARKRNGNLPGMGGVFNYVNMHVYHYAGNNPVKYTDPDGRIAWWVVPTLTVIASGLGGGAMSVLEQIANQLGKDKDIFFDFFEIVANINGETLGNLNMGKLGVDVATGVLSGFLALVGIEMQVEILGNFALGLYGNIIGQRLTGVSEEEVDIEKALKAGLWATIFPTGTRLFKERKK